MDLFPKELVEKYAEGSRNNAYPVNFGLLLYPSFQALDTFGPIDILNGLAFFSKTNLYVIGPTMDPVSTAPPAMANLQGSSVAQLIVPTHTYDNAPPLDVLLVPGGLGTVFLPKDMEGPIKFIKERYPSLKYILTVCSGSWLAAEAGILDGKSATSNKALWPSAIKLGTNVNWVQKARWVNDGNIWTTSGVSAGIDGMLDFVEKVYGKDLADSLTAGLEYDRHTDPSWDPWAEVHKS